MSIKNQMGIFSSVWQQGSGSLAGRARVSCGSRIRRGCSGMNGWKKQESEIGCQRSGKDRVRRSKVGDQKPEIVVDAAYHNYRGLGPGLLESVYEVFFYPVNPVDPVKVLRSGCLLICGNLRLPRLPSLPS